MKGNKYIGAGIIVAAVAVSIFILFFMSEGNTNQNKKVAVQTSHGVFEIELDQENAPKTTDNFLALVDKDFYNGVRFHRVIDDFVIQGGDPISKDADRKSEWGTGGPGYQFEDEIHEENQNTVYSVAMANAGPNTNGSQFFVNLGENKHLDERHTVFGKVVSGHDVIDKIAKVETDERDAPIEEVLIKSIVIAD